MINERAKKLGDALVAVKIITPEQLKSALEAASKDGAPGVVIGLLETGLLTFKTFEKFISSTMGIQSAIVSNRPAVKEALALVGFENMLHNMIYPFGLREEKGQRTIALGMVDPTDQDAIDFLQKKTGCRIFPVLISLPDFKEAMKRNFHHNQVEVETEKKEDFVVIRAGQEGEEEVVPQHGTQSTEINEGGNNTFQTTKTVQPKPGWDMKTFQFNPQALGAAEFFGKNNKKFREEILAKLDIAPEDVTHLRDPDYTRDMLTNHLKNISPSRLTKIYNDVPGELKLEALINLLIRIGAISKHDMLISAAVSMAFHEGNNAGGFQAVEQEDPPPTSQEGGKINASGDTQ